MILAETKTDQVSGLPLGKSDLCTPAKQTEHSQQSRITEASQPSGSAPQLPKADVATSRKWRV
jgi:hypothetical protein